MTKTIPAKFWLEWTTEGDEFEYEPGDVAGSNKNLKMVVSKCRVVQGFLDLLYGGSGGALSQPIDIRLVVEDTGAGDGSFIVPVNSLKGPVDDGFAQHPVAASDYNARHQGLLDHLSEGELELPGDTLPPAGQTAPLQFRLGDTSNSDLLDAIARERYVRSGDDVICELGSALYLATPAADKEMIFNLANGKDGSIHMEARVSFSLDEIPTEE